MKIKDAFLCFINHFLNHLKGLFNTVFPAFGFLCLSYMAVPAWFNKLLSEKSRPDFSDPENILAWLRILLCTALIMRIYPLGFHAVTQRAKCFPFGAKSALIEFAALCVAAMVAHAFFRLMLFQSPYGYILILLELWLLSFWKRKASSSS